MMNGTVKIKVAGVISTPLWKSAEIFERRILARGLSFTKRQGKSSGHSYFK